MNNFDEETTKAVDLWKAVIFPPRKGIHFIDVGGWPKKKLTQYLDNYLKEYNKEKK